VSLSAGGERRSVTSPDSPATDRLRLGTALEGRVTEISYQVLTMWRRRSPAAASAAATGVEDDILRTTAQSTRSLVEYFVWGEMQSEEQARAIAATGKAPLRDTIALAELTKLYLYWREITIAVLLEEGARQGLDDAAVNYAVAIVRSASDRSVVRMTKQFDTERTRLQQELAIEQTRLAHHAYHDALTGLPNRRLFFDRLSHALEISHRLGIDLGLLFVDLDRFKAINDRLGHLAGDQVLIATAERLLAACRESDTVARLGGDEFVILCEHLHEPTDQLIALAERIGHRLAAPVITSEEQLDITASIGITTTIAGDNADALLRQADRAMYIAKRDRPGRYHVWSGPATDHEEPPVNA